MHFEEVEYPSPVSDTVANTLVLSVPLPHFTIGYGCTKIGIIQLYDIRKDGVYISLSHSPVQIVQ